MKTPCHDIDDLGMAPAQIHEVLDDDTNGDDAAGNELKGRDENGIAKGEKKAPESDAQIVLPKPFVEDITNLFWHPCETPFPNRRT